MNYSVPYNHKVKGIYSVKGKTINSLWVEIIGFENVDGTKQSLYQSDFSRELNKDFATFDVKNNDIVKLGNSKPVQAITNTKEKILITRIADLGKINPPKPFSKEKTLKKYKKGGEFESDMSRAEMIEFIKKNPEAMLEKGGSFFEKLKKKSSELYHKAKPHVKKAYDTAKPHVKHAYETGKKKAKEAYETGKEKVKDKIHDTKKDIALKVIDDTIDQVKTTDEKRHLVAAEEIVSEKYEREKKMEKGGDLPEKGKAQVGKFSVDNKKYYRGFTFGDKWNGWEVPYFDKTVSEKIAKDMQGKFDAKKGSFFFPENDEEFKSRTIYTEKGRKKLWSIGGYHWTWKLDEKEYGGVMEKGGTIPNNYFLKSEQEVWDAWSPIQRVHFMEDHIDWVFNHKNYNRKTDDVSKMSSKDYRELSFLWKNAVFKHVSEGQYGKGGEIENQYLEKSAEEVWEAWTPIQRAHFILDHLRSDSAKSIPKNELSAYDQVVNSSYSELDNQWKQVIESHVSTGQYGKGGKFKNNTENYTKSDIENLLEQLAQEKFAKELSTDNLADYKIDSDTTHDGRGNEMAVIWLEIQNPKSETLEILDCENGYKELLPPFEKWAKENNLSIEGLELTTTDEAEPKIIISVTEYINGEYEGGGMIAQKVGFDIIENVNATSPEGNVINISLYHYPENKRLKYRLFLANHPEKPFGSKEEAIKEFERIVDAYEGKGYSFEKLKTGSYDSGGSIDSNPDLQQEVISTHKTIEHESIWGNPLLDYFLGE